MPACPNALDPDQVPDRHLSQLCPPLHEEQQDVSNRGCVMCRDWCLSPASPHMLANDGLGLTYLYADV